MARQRREPPACGAPPWRLAARGRRPPTTVRLPGGLAIGPQALTIIAGPCAVESPAQIAAAAKMVAATGCRLLRGGAFKPRTSPYSFRGLGERGLALLRAAADAHGLLAVSEAVSPENLARVAAVVDIVQIGARNMQNFALLEAAGGCGKPVLLKRGMAASLDEWLLAAEYVLAAGNPAVILCERGIRTMTAGPHAVLDLAAVPRLRALTHLPVLVDPSHAAADAAVVPALALAAAAAGADGLLLEAHPRPAAALSDGPQSLTAAALRSLLARLRALVPLLGRHLV